MKSKTEAVLRCDRKWLLLANDRFSCQIGIELWMFFEAFPPDDAR